MTTPYHGALMAEGALSQSLPRHVNPRKMAYAGTVLCGKVDANRLNILADAVDYIGDICVSLGFSIGDQGKLLVTGRIDAELAHQCQRCLKTMPSRHDIAEVAVCVVRNEDEAKQLPGSLDPWVVSDEDADFYAFIEEELLLILPVVAYHEEHCIDLSDLSTDADNTVSDNNQSNPFSVLSALKKSDEAGTE